MRLQRHKHPPKKEGCFFMAANKLKVILFANGDLPDPEHIAEKITQNDFLVAVDGGLHHMTALGLKPDLIIGDLDSVNNEELEHFQKQNVKIEKFPVEKDQNDLELALQAAIAMNPETIWIIAALGNRIDQTLANIFLLTRDDLVGIDAHLVDGQRDVFLIRKQATLIGDPDQRISLIPLLGPVTGIQTTGLKYPLKNETLYPDHSRGISNRLTESSASITIENGLLLCVQQLITKDERNL
jgi:thiamine pyrophosphokinase